MSENSIIRDNAEIILKNVKEGIFSPKDLTQEMRRVCVNYLHRQGDMTQEEMAETLGVSTKTIQRDVETIEQNYASLLTSLDYKRIVGGLICNARHIIQKAMKKEDYRLAWQVETDLGDKLMELGFLKKAPSEILLKTEKAEDLTVEEAAVIDTILMKVAERRNLRENAGLMDSGQGLIDGGQDARETGDGKDNN